MHAYTQVLQSHTRSGIFLGDYCDGTLYKTHELYSLKPSSLLSELEVCNPLGAQRGIHKLGNPPP